MIAYWDTSALLALVFKEIHTPAALQANATATANYAWRWLEVEARAGLLRRRATESAWAELQVHLHSITWLDLPVADHPALLALNQRHRLRAADAGHLHCFQRAAHVLPDLVLVSFDAELTAAARSEKLRLFAP
jgi:hypothetical protein